MNNQEWKLCLGCMSPKEDLAAACPVCARRADTPYDVDYLRPGSLLEERYLVGDMLSSNDESAVYIGFDTKESQKILLREFMPHSLVRRNQLNQSIIPLQRQSQVYQEYLEAFDELVRQLTALSGNEAVIPVCGCFSSNNTRYIVFKYIDTLTLNQFLSRSGGTIRWSAAKKLFMPLFTSLSNLHSRGICHLGLSPENLLIDSAGKLWFWGLATLHLRSRAGAIDSELFPGYSAPEQYAENAFQGRFTDVYAAGALLYRTLTGTTPPDALSRVTADSLLPASQLDETIPEEVSDAISAAMVVQADYRTQTVDELTANLLESSSGNTAVFDAGNAEKFSHKQEEAPQAPPSTPEHKGSPRSAAYVLVTMVVTLVLICLSMGYLWFDGLQDLFTPASASQSESSSQEEQTEQPTPSFVGLYIGEAQKKNDSYSVVTVEEYNEQYPEGVVFDQSPKEGVAISKGAVITLHVSKGSEMVKMPKLVGSTLEFAITTLVEDGIQYSVIPEDAPKTAIVERTDKTEGTEIRKNKDRVTIFVEVPASSESQSEEDDGIIIDPEAASRAAGRE